MTLQGMPYLHPAEPAMSVDPRAFAEGSGVDARRRRAALLLPSVMVLVSAVRSLTRVPEHGARETSVVTLDEMSAVRCLQGPAWSGACPFVIRNGRSRGNDKRALGPDPGRSPGDGRKEQLRQLDRTSRILGPERRRRH